MSLMKLVSKYYYTTVNTEENTAKVTILQYETDLPPEDGKSLSHNNTSIRIKHISFFNVRLNIFENFLY